MADLHWPPVDEEALQPLPPVLRAMVKALGFGRASVFLQEFGGIPFTLPKVKDAKLGLLPDEIARLRVSLKPHLDADNRIALPKADKLLAYVRNQEIAKKKESESIAAQAKKYHLTTRQVINLRGGHSRYDAEHKTLKRNLVLSKDELDALTKLAYKAAALSGDMIYTQILNKLDRAGVKLHNDRFQESQFDLF